MQRKSVRTPSLGRVLDDSYDGLLAWGLARPLLDV